MDDTQAAPSPLRAESGSALDLDRYMLNGENEIRQLLRELAEHSELVTLYFGSANDFLLTSVLAVSGEAVILDYGSNENMNKRMLTSGRLIFITSREKIKVQWNASRIWRVNYENRPAFCIAVPESMLRLQRREYYRLAAPIAKPLVCNIPVDEEGKQKFAFTVSDISIGGIAVHGPVKQAQFEIGKAYRNCEISLPGLGTLVADITIANVFDVTLRNGSTTTRAGCRFGELRGKNMMLLQRYINQVERERRERMARFA
jgi:c-di-GMP-binding flagellar brake protein YcgR